MTEEELDILASAYVDGEASPTERALVESDPTLQARVAEFRSLANAVGQVTPADEATRLAQLAQAVSQTPGEPVGESGVIDLSERRAALERPPIEQRPPAMVRWLAPAAGLLLLLIGGGFLLNGGFTGGQSDDTADVAVGAFETESTDEDSAFEDSAFEDSAFEDSAADTGADEASAMAESAEAAMDSDDAMDDSAADVAASSSTTFARSSDEEDEAEESADDGSGGDDTDSSRPPLVEYAEGEAIEMVEVDLAALAEEPATPWGDPANSTCAQDITVFPTFEPYGYLPVTVGGDDYEIIQYVIQDQAGDEPVLVMADLDCKVIEEYP